MIISILGRKAGFYSELFFLMNHYLFCKKTNNNFNINSANWLFKYNKGWEDYFRDINIIDSCDFYNGIYGHHDQIDNFSIKEYKIAIKDIYIYNEIVTTEIKKIKQQLQLKNDYDAIFIRRGDKLVNESEFIKSEKYVDSLLSKKKNCNTIFVQTDDYNCYLEIKDYIEKNNLNINVITLCKKKNIGGMVIFNYYKNSIEMASKDHKINGDYLTSVIDNLRSIVSVDQLNNEEIYEHTLEMIIGIDIVLNADKVICDYSSNVSRFIKLANKNSDNVFDVNNLDNDIDWEKYICPAFGL